MLSDYFSSQKKRKKKKIPIARDTEKENRTNIIRNNNGKWCDDFFW